MLRDSWLSSVRFVLIAPVPLNEPSSRGLVKFGRLKACGADVIVLVVGVAVAAVAVAVVDATIKGAAVASGAGVVVLAAVMLSQVCVAPVSAG